MNQRKPVNLARLLAILGILLAFGLFFGLIAALQPPAALAGPEPLPTLPVYDNDLTDFLWHSPVQVAQYGQVFFPDMPQAPEAPSYLYPNGVAALWSQDHPVVAYTNIAGLLLVQAAQDWEGLSWGTPFTISQTAGEISQRAMAMVNGAPALCFYDTSTYSVQFATAKSAAGDDWNPPVMVDMFISPGAANCAILTIGGYPAVIYENLDSGRLSINIAMDPTGSSFSASLPVPLTDNAGNPSVIMLPGGFPAIAYVNQSTWELMLTIGQDLLGFSWSTPLTVTGNVGNVAALELVNGLPAVAYYDFSQDLAYFMQANDLAGSSWKAPAPFSGLYTSPVILDMQVIGGRPQVLYIEGLGDLRSVHGLDADGGSWSQPVTLASVDPWAGALIAMPESAATAPGVTYFNGSDSQLKFMRGLPLAYQDPSALTGQHNGAQDWADFDADGDLDLLSSGITDNPSLPPSTLLYQNGAGLLTETLAGLPPLAYSAQAWAIMTGTAISTCCWPVYRANLCLSPPQPKHRRWSSP